MLLKLLQSFRIQLFLKKKMALLPLALFLWTSISAQQCIPSAPVCSEAIAMCTPSVSFSLPDGINNSGAIPGCGGAWSYHNTVWYVFTAKSPNIALNISSGNCSQGGGFQAGLYDDCDLNAQPLGLQCSCVQGSVNFSAQVTPFQQYYIMVDGCSGNVCEMNITVVQGEINECFLLPPEAPLAPTPSNNPVCPGLIVELSTNAVQGAIAYDWNFPAGVTPIDLNCNNATVVWGTSSGNVTVTAYFPNSPFGETSEPTWVQMTEPIGQETGFYCYPDEPGWFYAETASLYTEGNYQIVLPARSSLGCDSTVFLTVTEQLTFPGIINTSICPGDSIEINGIYYSATGGYEQVFSNGSSADCDSTVLIFLSRAEFEIVDTMTTDVGCGSCNGTLSFNINCGYAPLTISWSNGLAAGQTQFDSLCAGTYTVTVSDGIGDSLIQSFVIGGGSGLTLAASSEDISCNGYQDGSIDIDVQGGAGGYTFDWSDDSLDGEEDPTGLDAGTYDLTVTDADGCSGSVSVTIEEPAPLDLSLDIEDITCDELGSITSTVTGGTAPYTYWWNTGDLTPSLTDLNVGYYLLVVTDDNGCENERDAVINTPLILNGEPQNTFESGLAASDTLNCGELSITLQANPYDSTSFNWSTNDGNIVRSLGNRMELNEGGTYYLEMSIEVNGEIVCMLLDSIVIEKECCPVEFHVESTDETCLGIDDGTAMVVIDGMGLPPYTFEWSDPNLPNESSVTGLAAGMYTITLTDAAGCSDEVSFEIDAYLDISLSTTPADCDGFGGTASVSGGGFFVYYSWSNGGTGNMQTGLDAGEYTVRAWSIFGGCQSQITFTIELDSSCNDAAFINAAELETNEEAVQLQLPGLNIQSATTLSSSVNLHLFPNPVINVGYVKIQLPAADQIVLSLYDVKGEIMKSVFEKLPAGEHQLEWDMSNFSTGVYYVHLRTSSGLTKYRKWVKIQ